MNAGADQAAPGHFVRRAGDPAHATRLRRQAELLAVADVPGAVKLVTLEGPPDEPVLLTVRVDGPDLSRGPELTVDEVAGLVVELAGTVAGLHELGVVHGAVMAEHVLLSSDGRPVLCGFGYGARTGEPPLAEAPLPEAALDPARAAGDPLLPASDVLALGALLDALLDATAPANAGRADVDALRAVASRTMAPAPDLRPSARSVAEAVRHAAPSARLPSPPSLGSGDDRAPRSTDALKPLRAGSALQGLRRGRGANHLPIGRRRHRPKAAVLVGAVLAAVVLGALVVRAATGGSGRSRPQVGSAAPASRPTTLPPPDTALVATTLPSPPTAGALPPPGCPAVAGLLAADTDGDGCAEALRWEAGVVAAGDRRWSVGQAGDVAVTGDWTCAGVATLAVLRPGTGQVFVFDRWAARGEELAAPQAARVEGAFALRTAELDADACPDLVVERSGRPPATVPLPGERR